MRLEALLSNVPDRRIASLQLPHALGFASKGQDQELVEDVKEAGVGRG